MSSGDVVWHMHRHDWHPDRDTVRGTLVGSGGAKGALAQTFHTVERISTIIPAGDYTCAHDYWHRGKMPAYEIIWPWDEDGDGQPDRDRLLFHPANAIRNKGGEYCLLGCIAMGRGLGTFWGAEARKAEAKDLPGVTHSVAAFKDFMKANHEVLVFTLRITEEHEEVDDE